MPSTAASPALPTDTVTRVAPVRAPPFRDPVTVTAVGAAFSATDVGLTDSSTSVDSVSSSVIVRSVPLTLRPMAVVVPVTENFSAPSPSGSSAGVSVNVAVPEVWPASMVSVKSLTAA